jgi:hypothetical protein
MDYQQLLALRQHHPAWRLLRADNAPLIAAFLAEAFVVANRRSLDEHALASLLEGSDESARYGLELFRRLNLQLQIVTPCRRSTSSSPTSPASASCTTSRAASRCSGA